MCLLLREALSIGKIAIAHEFFSNELKITEAKLRINDELSSYCVVTEPPKTTFGKVRTTYTGKLYGKQDDLCIAIQLSIIGCQKVHPVIRILKPTPRMSTRLHVHSTILHSSSKSLNIATSGPLITSHHKGSESRRSFRRSDHAWCRVTFACGRHRYRVWVLSRL